MEYMKERILKTSFIILFFILIGEIFFVIFDFYIKNKKIFKEKEKNNNIIIHNKSKEINSSDLKNNLRKELMNLVNKKLNNKEAINYLEVFRSIDKENNCDEEKCIYDNFSNQFWKTDYDEEKFIKIKKFLKIKLSLESKNSLTGISLNNSFSKKDEEWYKNSVNIFIGVRDNGREFYIDARNRSEQAVIIVDNINLDKNNFYIYTDKQGKYFIITDYFNNIIYEFDINEKTNNLFPNGIFPDNKIIISYLVAPYSKLVLKELLIWDIE